MSKEMRQMNWRTCTSVFLALLPISSCAGVQKEPLPPVQEQTAADEVLRISDIWTSSHPEKGILSPPSKISMFNNVRKSQIRVSEAGVSETLYIEEHLKLRDGTAVDCQTQFKHDVQFRWGRRQGEAALELLRPALSGPRNCTGIHPDGAFSEASRRALFVLRSDNLVVVEPALDKRSYIPGQL